MAALLLLTCIPGAFSQNRKPATDKKPSVTASEQAASDDLVAAIHGKDNAKIAAAVDKISLLKFEKQPALGAKAHLAAADFFAAEHAHRHAAGHYREAIAFISATDGSDKNEIRFTVTLQLAAELEKINRSDSARAVLQQALREAEIVKSNAFLAEANLRFGNWYLDHFQPEKALEHYEKAEAAAGSDSSKTAEIQMKTILATLRKGDKIQQSKLDRLPWDRLEPNNRIELQLEYARYLLRYHYDIKAKEMIDQLDAVATPELRPIIDYLNLGYYLSISEAEKARTIWLKSEPQLVKRESGIEDQIWDARLINSSVPEKIRENRAEEGYLKISPMVMTGLCVLLATLIVLVVVLIWPKRNRSTVITSIEPPKANVSAMITPHHTAHSSEARVTRVHRSVLEAVLKRLAQLVGINDNTVIQQELTTLITQLEDLLNLGREKATMLSNIDHLHDDFTRRLKEKHAHLNDKEIRLAELVRLNLSVPEIALLLHVSQESVEERLRKLKDQLFVKEDEDLYLVVANI
ncbi:MAG: hypothetical protein V4616_06595 [Bacteroidota bacterium]